MHLRHTYNALVRRAHDYLTTRRAQGRWERHLPERIFDSHLWLWEQQSVARGAGWGAAMAIFPIPMQSLAAIIPCLWIRGNIPISMLCCWISFPGYQVIAWPLQWMLGAWLMRTLTPWSSGASVESIYTAVGHWQQGWQEVLAQFPDVGLRLLTLEFALGCLISSLLMGYLFYAFTRLLPRRLFDE